jgi:hypothetical protein
VFCIDLTFGSVVALGQIGCAHEQCCSRPSDFRDIRNRTECSQATEVGGSANGSPLFFSKAGQHRVAGCTALALSRHDKGRTTRQKNPAMAEPSILPLAGSV